MGKRSKRGAPLATASSAAHSALPEAVPELPKLLDTDLTQPLAGDGAEAVAPKRRRRTGAQPAVRHSHSLPAAATSGQVDAAVAGHEVGNAAAEEAVSDVAAARKPGGRRRPPDPLPCQDPTPELLVSLAGRAPSPLPVPNLGYACLCEELRELKPPVFTSRDCIKRTLDEKGLPYLGELCLANCRDLARVIQWNHEHGIRLFRMSSVLWPWMGTFEARDLPQYGEIGEALRFAGDLARAYGQRLTFHPSHFVKLAAPVETLVAKSLRELEAHSEILDLMGFEPSPENKINIHIGGVYSADGDKRATMERWAAAYRRLSLRCQRRVTVENDDVASAFSLEDLLYLHGICGVPLVFDFHHHRFCPGSLTEDEALRAAVATWPQGVRPVVHWSESSGPGRRPHAHSDYVRGPIDARALHGLEARVDVMVESKRKERALLALREGRVPLDEWAAAPPAGEEAAGGGSAPAAAGVSE